MFECSDCYKEFTTAGGLHAHCRAKADHAYCEDCERLFVGDFALNQHLRDSPAHRDDSDDNLASSDYFDDESESEDTSDDDGGTAFCQGCNRIFIDKMSLYQHLLASSKHNWCFTCSRDFVTEDALEKHSASRVHKTRDLDCPLCKKSFALPSAIAHHIESGGCHKKIDRHRVTAAVHSMGVIPVISLSHRLQGSSPSNAPRRIVHYSASEQAFNGSSYECYVCHRTFRALGSLNTHLNSAAHDVDEFKCPKCSSKFKLISSLIQHIETEVCGLARFQQVEDHTSALTAQFSRLLKM